VLGKNINFWSWAPVTRLWDQVSIERWKTHVRVAGQAPGSVLAPPERPPSAAAPPRGALSPSSAPRPPRTAALSAPSRTHCSSSSFSLFNFFMRYYLNKIIFSLAIDFFCLVDNLLFLFPIDFPSEFYRLYLVKINFVIVLLIHRFVIEKWGMKYFRKFDN